MPCKKLSTKSIKQINNLVKKHKGTYKLKKWKNGNLTLSFQSK